MAARKTIGIVVVAALALFLVVSESVRHHFREYSETEYVETAVDG
jgi:hypothetical protein